MLDPSTSSVIILFFANLILLLIILISFGVIRKIRGDKAKVKISKRVLKELGLDDDYNNELEALLLENPITSNNNISHSL
jgi:hypothetical protein